METIKDIVNKTLAKVIAEGSIEKSIAFGVERAIETAIAAQFESYGAITKGVERGIEQGLHIDSSRIPFESYNEQVLVAVKTKMGSMFAGQAYEKFMEDMGEVLAPAPDTVPLKDIQKYVTYTIGGQRNG